MARGYMQVKPEKPLVLHDVEYFRKMKGGGLPHVKKLKDWVETEDDRDLLAETVQCGLKAMHMKPVRSNAELLQRIDEYFDSVIDRRVPPTVEEFSLYLGGTTATLYDWQNGLAAFPDVPEPGLTTSEISKKALQLLHNIDAVQAMKRKSDTTAYIFRSKNYYGMQDVRERKIDINVSAVPEALPPSEVAKYLPELAPDTSMDDVDIW